MAMGAPGRRPEPCHTRQARFSALQDHGADKTSQRLAAQRDLYCQYKTAFVLSHKLREAMATEAADETIFCTVEMDRACFGGYVKPANNKANRVDRRLAKNRTGKNRVAVIIR